jgi:hypothetical protein
VGLDTLKPLALVCTIVVDLSGNYKSCEITPSTFMVWPSPCIGGNGIHDVLARNSIVVFEEMAGSIEERPKQKQHLCMEKD